MPELILRKLKELNEIKKIIQEMKAESNKE
jgi:hypothetical protein